MKVHYYTNLTNGARNIQGAALIEEIPLNKVLPYFMFKILDI